MRTQIEELEEKPNEETWKVRDLECDKSDGEICRTSQVVAEVEAPDREEVERHNPMHIPHEPCCLHCAYGRGTNDAHKCERGVDTQIPRDTTKPPFSMDCATVVSEEDVEDTEIETFVIADDHCGTSHAHRMLRKWQDVNHHGCPAELQRTSTMMASKWSRSTSKEIRNFPWWKCRLW